MLVLLRILCYKHFQHPVHIFLIIYIYCISNIICVFNFCTAIHLRAKAANDLANWSANRCILAENLNGPLNVNEIRAIPLRRQSIHGSNVAPAAVRVVGSRLAGKAAMWRQLGLYVFGLSTSAYHRNALKQQPEGKWVQKKERWDEMKELISKESSRGYQCQRMVWQKKIHPYIYNICAHLYYKYFFENILKANVSIHWMPNAAHPSTYKIYIFLYACVVWCGVFYSGMANFILPSYALLASPCLAWHRCQRKNRFLRSLPLISENLCLKICS